MSTQGMWGFSDTEGVYLTRIRQDAYPAAFINRDLYDLIKDMKLEEVHDLTYFMTDSFDDIVTTKDIKDILSAGPDNGVPFFDSPSFVTSSCCEWIYIINVDTGMLEIYGNRDDKNKAVFGGFRSNLNLLESIPLSVVDDVRFNTWKTAVIDAVDQNFFKPEIKPIVYESIFVADNNIDNFIKKLSEATGEGFEAVSISYTAHLVRKAV